MLAEQRARAEQLARINTALSASMAALSSQATPDQVVGAINQLMVETLGGEAAAVFQINNAAGRLDGGLIVDRGMVAPVKEILHTNLSDIPAWPRILANLHATVMQLDADNSHGIHAATAQFMRAHGYTWLVNLPLRVGNEPLWLLAVTGVNTERLTHEHLDLFETLSNQLKLALELKRLGERAQASALAQERARIAGQIHDTLAQGFTGALLHLEALSVRVSRGHRATADELQVVRKIAALGLAEARRSALVIRPLALDDRDLPTALHQLTERSRVPGLLACEWSLRGNPRPLPPATEDAFLNIAHEAVNNAIRHADAARIDIGLAFEADGVTLHISDDGRGFDASAPRRRGHSFGLRSMQERAESINAPFTVRSEPGRGTSITTFFPYP